MDLSESASDHSKTATDTTTNTTTNTTPTTTTIDLTESPARGSKRRRTAFDDGTDANFSVLSTDATQGALLREASECSICRDIVCFAHALPCSHLFCRECLLRWLHHPRAKEHQSCPECRAPIKSPPTPVPTLDKVLGVVLPFLLNASELKDRTAKIDRLLARRPAGGWKPMDVNGEDMDLYEGEEDDDEEEEDDDDYGDDGRLQFMFQMPTPIEVVNFLFTRGGGFADALLMSGGPPTLVPRPRTRRSARRQQGTNRTATTTTTTTTTTTFTGSDVVDLTAETTAPPAEGTDTASAAAAGAASNSRNKNNGGGHSEGHPPEIVTISLESQDSSTGEKCYDCGIALIHGSSVVSVRGSPDLFRYHPACWPPKEGRDRRTRSGLRRDHQVLRRSVLQYPHADVVPYG